MNAYYNCVLLWLIYQRCIHIMHACMAKKSNVVDAFPFSFFLSDVLRSFIPELHSCQAYLSIYK